MEILLNAHSQGIVCGVSNIVDEYMNGKYNRTFGTKLCLLHRMCDEDLLIIPHYLGDHWVQDSEEKCKELLSSANVATEPQEEVDSDVMVLFTSHSDFDFYDRQHVPPTKEEGQKARKTGQSDVRIYAREIHFLVLF